MREPTRKGGRPGRKPATGERVGLSLRVTPEVKTALEQAARQSGRSLSQEAEFRLDRSFQDVQLLPQLLDLAFGRQTAGLLLLLGRTIGEASGFGALMAGNPAGDWIGDPWTYQQVEKAMRVVLSALKPPGEPEPPKVLNDMPEPLRAGLADARHFAKSVLLAASFSGLSEGELEQAMRPVRDRLGHILKRKSGGENAG